jgi:uncharacterized SAM-binding protein YcdF (DUF218 family)
MTRCSGQADAIVVLGCRLTQDGRPSPALRRRVGEAVRLLEAGAAPVLVLSGGGTGPRPEAAAMRELALAAGIPAAALRIEDRSRDTRENAVITASLLHREGLGTVILVSDRYHLLRARLLFRLAGVRVAGTAAPPRRVLAMAPMYLREAVALLPSLARLALCRRC